MRRPANDLRQELFQNGQWHVDSFHVIYHELEQDPRPFAVLHHHGLEEIQEYNKLVELACEYITDTRDKAAAKILERLTYDDAQAFWRSFTVRVGHDPSYNERHFHIIFLMWEYMQAARDTLSSM